MNNRSESPTRKLHKTKLNRKTMHAYVYIYVYAYVCIQTHTHKYIYIRMHTCVTCIQMSHAHVHTCKHIDTHIYIHMTSQRKEEKQNKGWKVKKRG